MGRGSYVGRVAGLTVAFGVGAAVFTGVASAQPSDGSGSEPSAPTAASADSSSARGSTGTRSTPSADASDSRPTSTFGTPDAAPGAERARAGSDLTTPKDPTPPKRKKKPTTEPTSDVDSAEPSPTLSVAAAVDTADAAAEDKQPAAETAAVEVRAPATTNLVVQQAEPENAKPDPKQPVTVEVSGLVGALGSPFADDGDAPTAPVGSPAAWTLAAAARRELLATAPTYDEPVVAIPQTPLLTALGLQQLPVIGPLFVTPVIALLHQTPLIGDILHPFIGYPLGMTGGITPRDVKVVSFDGAEIYVHFFPAIGLGPGETAPTILNGPGLGLPGETNPLAETNPFLVNQVIGMAPLLRGGYNVVTWDPRGEWSSGGRLQVDHPDFEGRDMQAIISWISQQPEVSLDAPGDPRIGMVGASYGGGIQLVTAAIDKRVDAIVPTIAWNNLNTSLAKNGAPKTSWGAVLTLALVFTGARMNSEIVPTVLSALLNGEVSQHGQNFLDARSPDVLLDDITAPTLFVQGTVDTLFSLQEAHDNAMVLIGNEVPTKVVWYCGGHGACLSSAHDGAVINRATLQWLDRYVKGLPVDTGAQFEWVDQHGQQFSSDVYPVRQGTPLTVSTADGSLPLRLFFGGSGPNLRALQAGLIGAILGVLSGAEARNAVELTLPPRSTTTYLVGAPQLDLTYVGTGFNRHVYAQLVDDTTGLVLGNQVTPIPVTLDGQTHTVRIPLEQIAHTLRPGETVTLQLVASAITYQPLWTSGSLSVLSMQLSLPTADTAAFSVTPFAAATTASAALAA